MFCAQQTSLLQVEAFSAAALIAVVMLSEKNRCFFFSRCCSHAKQKRTGENVCPRHDPSARTPFSTTISVVFFFLATCLFTAFYFPFVQKKASKFICASVFAKGVSLTVNKAGCGGGGVRRKEKSQLDWN